MAPPATEQDGNLALWVCNRCGWVYAPAEGDLAHDVPPMTAFEHLPPGWTCPSCGSDRDYFFH